MSADQTSPANLQTLARSITEPHRNILVGTVNDGCIRLAVNEDSTYDWHHHPNSDELFAVLEGTLHLEFKDREKVVLGPNDVWTVPAGVVHRTVAVGRTVNICVEKASAETIFEKNPSEAPRAALADGGITATSESNTRLRKELVEQFSGSELHSLLIDVYSDRASAVTISKLLNAWRDDRFVKPGSVSPRALLKFDLMAYEVADSFDAIELSPVCPFGTNVVVAPVSQKKILSTIRNTEVVADSTNVMALECADRRARHLKGEAGRPPVERLCTSHRLVRTQLFGPGMSAHFRVFSLCTAGRDTGNFQFEAAALTEQVSVLYRIFGRLNQGPFEIRNPRLGLFGKDPYLLRAVKDVLMKAIPDVAIEEKGLRSSGYYPTISFKLHATNHEGTEIELADGGLVDWTQKLLGNSKERLMISGLGTERLLSQFPRPSGV